MSIYFLCTISYIWGGKKNLKISKTWEFPNIAIFDTIFQKQKKNCLPIFIWMLDPIFSWRCFKWCLEGKKMILLTISIMEWLKSGKVRTILSLLDSRPEVTLFARYFHLVALQAFWLYRNSLETSSFSCQISFKDWPPSSSLLWWFR